MDTDHHGVHAVHNTAYHGVSREAWEWDTGQWDMMISGDYERSFQTHSGWAGPSLRKHEGTGRSGWVMHSYYGSMD